ncbi:hypothetical protein FPQ18DRAFT_303863 [Pyronema domesticum]|nr:hypothetical protein FPQ18DRAFT_303863 [Pyronema domesticum]
MPDILQDSHSTHYGRLIALNRTPTSPPWNQRFCSRSNIEPHCAPPSNDPPSVEEATSYPTSTAPLCKQSCCAGSYIQPNRTSSLNDLPPLEKDTSFLDNESNNEDLAGKCRPSGHPFTVNVLSGWRPVGPVNHNYDRGQRKAPERQSSSMRRDQSHTKHCDGRGRVNEERPKKQNNIDYLVPPKTARNDLLPRNAGDTMDQTARKGHRQDVPDFSTEYSQPLCDKIPNCDYRNGNKRSSSRPRSSIGDRDARRVHRSISMCGMKSA